MAKKTKENAGNGERKRYCWNEIRMTAEEFQDRCDEFIEQCRSKGEIPSPQGFAVFCGISVDTYEKWRANRDKKHSRYSAVIKRNDALSSHLLQQQKDGMSVFRLKQPCYGGFSDKQDNGTGHDKLTIEVVCNGAKVN